MAEICPNCRRAYSPARNTGDFAHQCNSGDVTLDQEDVQIVGAWTDYSGSGGTSNKPMMNLGLGNELEGTEAGMLGQRSSQRTDRGKNQQLYRQRPHIEYIERK